MCVCVCVYVCVYIYIYIYSIKMIGKYLLNTLNISGIRLMPTDNENTKNLSLKCRWDYIVAWTKQVLIKVKKKSSHNTNQNRSLFGEIAVNL